MYESIPPRQVAKEKGLKTYLSGKPCKRGHTTPRHTATGSCIECHRMISLGWKKTHTESCKAYDAKRNATNPSRGNAYKSAWKQRNAAANKALNDAYRLNNKDKVLAACKTWRKANKEKAKAMAKSWRLRNRDKVVAQVNRRRCKRISATPFWADHTKINLIYKQAVESGLTVDHVIPLIHELVCGLHVHFNMQLLTLSENSSKGNKFIID